MAKYNTGPKPLIVRNPKDKKLKAYNDSLSLYNSGNSQRLIAQEIAHNRIKDWNGYHRPTVVETGDKANPNDFYVKMKTKNGIAPIEKAMFTYKGGDATEDKLPDQYFPVYKKPTRPVKYIPEPIKTEVNWTEEFIPYDNPETTKGVANLLISEPEFGNPNSQPTQDNMETNSNYIKRLHNSRVPKKYLGGDPNYDTIVRKYPNEQDLFRTNSLFENNPSMSVDRVKPFQNIPDNKEGVKVDWMKTGKGVMEGLNALSDAKSIAAQSLSSGVDVANNVLGGINSARLKREEQQKIANALQQRPFENSEGVSNVPIYTKYGGGMPKLEGGDSNPNVEAEDGEVLQHETGTIFEADGDRHEQGGEKFSGIERVLEDTSTKRKDELSQLLKVDKKDASIIVGKKINRDLSHAMLFKKASEAMAEKQTKYLKAFKRVNKEKNPDIYSQASALLNSQNAQKIPTSQEVFDKIYEHQEAVKTAVGVNEPQDIHATGGPGPKATRQDSLNVYNNSVAVRKYYADKGYQEAVPGSIRTDVSPDWVHYLNEDNKIHEFAKKRYKEGDKSMFYIYTDKKGDEDPANMTYRKVLDENQFLQLPHVGQIVDRNAPLNLYDKRIKPTENRFISHQNGDGFSYYTYDPLTVKPYDMLTPQERMQRQPPVVKQSYPDDSETERMLLEQQSKGNTVNDKYRTNSQQNETNKQYILRQQRERKAATVNKQYGGKIDMAQYGQGPGPQPRISVIKNLRRQIAPYHTSNPNDPRIAAYNDSLTTYSQSEKYFKDLADNIDEYEMLGRPKGFWEKLNAQERKYNINLNLAKEINRDSETGTQHLMFSNPIQPVIYTPKGASVVKDKVQLNADDLATEQALMKAQNQAKYRTNGQQSETNQEYILRLQRERKAAQGIKQYGGEVEMAKYGKGPGPKYKKNKKGEYELPEATVTAKKSKYPWAYNKTEEEAAREAEEFGKTIPTNKPKLEFSLERLKAADMLPKGSFRESVSSTGESGAEMDMTRPVILDEGVKSKFNMPLGWNDLLAGVAGLTQAMNRDPELYNPVYLNKAKFSLQDSRQSLNNNQAEYNALKANMPNNSIGSAREAQLFTNKLKADADVIAQIQNANTQINNQQEQYNTGIKDKQSIADAQTRQSYYDNVQQARANQDEAKLRALENITDAVSKNKAFNKNGSLIMKLAPYFDQEAEYNGRKYNMVANDNTTGSSTPPGTVLYKVTRADGKVKEEYLTEAEYRHKLRDRGTYRNIQKISK